MKFICSIDIKASRDKVVDAFIDVDKQHLFQDGFISKKLISGSNNNVGAKSKLTYKRLVLIETVLKNNLPDEFEGLYEHKHTTNTMNVTFKQLGNNVTR